MFIILTPEQADEVRGPTLNNSALDPVAYGDVFILPAAVLSDLNHIHRHAFLSTLPQQELEVGE
jgi:hypothetical protein